MPSPAVTVTWCGELLTAPVPTGKSHQTYLRAILLSADHAAYHVGQIVAVRRALGIWN